MTNTSISSLTNLCNEIRKEFDMEYNYSDEEKQLIIETKPLLLSLQKDSSKCYKIYYNEFETGICDIISEKINKNIDNRIKKYAFIQLVSRDDIQTSKSIEQYFEDYFKKYNIYIDESSNIQIECKMITCKGGVYIRQTEELDSPVSKFCSISDNGILPYKTKFFSDYSKTISCFSNGEYKQIIRCRVVNKFGDELGWTSETNTKGDILCKTIPSANTSTFKFIYADNHTPDDVDYDSFKENIAPELGLDKIKEDILEEGFIELSKKKGVCSIKNIVTCYDRIIREDNNINKKKKKKKEEEKQDNRTELLKNIGSATAIGLSVGAMYKLNKMKNGDAKSSISRQAISSGLRHLSSSNTGIRSIIVDEIANYLDENTEGKLEILSMNGILGKVGVKCLQRMGLGIDIPDFQDNNNEETKDNKDEPHLKTNNDEDIDNLDNLLNIFKIQEQKDKENIKLENSFN